VKKIGELLSAFFDENTLEKAQKYNNLFSSWKEVAGENIAAHSRIVEIEKSVLRIEADHPGWIQILQTRQKSLLERVRRKFPALGITGISFKLYRNPVAPEETDRREERGIRPEAEDIKTTFEAASENLQELYAKISNNEMRESLKQIGKKAKRRR
jgi:predicted nucleic acid-binding Zn ribbon protein